jgi:ribosomal protein S18 acetylase RimI-like enzyme
MKQQARIVDGDQSILYVVETRSGEIVGSGVLWLLPMRHVLMDVYVSRHHRRRGIATQIVQSAIETSSREPTPLVLKVQEDNLPALDLYGGCGFSERARHADDIWMVYDADNVYLGCDITTTQRRGM